jgi:phospholipid/cholesterol/gamma-HCH transport system permease protein
MVELGPVLTALMVTGRVGSGMAAELGSMVVTQQIDALRVLGTDPIRKLVAPRLGAALVMVPILTVISDTVGIFGGSLISIFNLKLSWEFYWRSVANAMVINDLLMGFLKPLAFGLILASVGCYMGSQHPRRHQGVRDLDHAVGGRRFRDDPVLGLLHHQAPAHPVPVV